MDELKEDCGIFGIWNNPDAARLTYLGLYSLQHLDIEIPYGLVRLYECPSHVVIPYKRHLKRNACLL